MTDNIDPRAGIMRELLHAIPGLADDVVIDTGFALRTFCAEVLSDNGECDSGCGCGCFDLNFTVNGVKLFVTVRKESEHENQG